LINSTVSAFPKPRGRDGAPRPPDDLDGSGIVLEDVDRHRHVEPHRQRPREHRAPTTAAAAPTSRATAWVGGDIDSEVWVNSSVQGNVIRNGSILVHGSDGLSSHQRAGQRQYRSRQHPRRHDQHRAVDRHRCRRNAVAGYVVVGESFEPWVYQNVIGGCSPNGTAIEAASRSGAFEDNEFNGGCDHGLWLTDLSSGNVYAGNSFRVYVPVPELDEGVANVDGETPGIALGD
jgi:hypothetical protein